MKNHILVFGLSLCCILSGCSTYLGEDYVQSTIPKTEKKLVSETVEDYFWQYQIEDGRLTLVNSSRNLQVYDQNEKGTAEIYDVYMKFKTENYTYLTIFPLHVSLVFDVCRFVGRWFTYPCWAFGRSWHFRKDRGPGFWYSLAYCPVIANLNLFMLPPYLLADNEAGQYFREKQGTKSMIRHTKFCVEIEREVEQRANRYVLVDGKKFELDKTPHGTFTLNLRDQSVIPCLLPEKDIHIQVFDNGKNRIDLKVPARDLLDSREQMLWLTWKNPEYDFRTRINALEALRAAGRIDSKTAAAMESDLLAVK